MIIVMIMMMILPIIVSVSFFSFFFFSLQNKCNLVFWYNNVLDFIKKYAPAPTVNY